MENQEEKNSPKKSRFFACVSYIPDTETILTVLQSKQKSIRAYAVIKHDKDNADTHHHMVIRTHSNWTCPQVAKWFKTDNTDQNTFAQPVIDRNGIIEYLTHENEDDTKAKYDKSDIIDGGLDDLLPQEDSADNSYEIITALLNGTSIREMVRLYGRDFVYHYGSYRLLAEDVRNEEGFSNAIK